MRTPQRPTASPPALRISPRKGGRGGYCREECRHGPKRLVICDGPDVRTVVDGRYAGVVVVVVGATVVVVVVAGGAAVVVVVVVEVVVAAGLVVVVGTGVAVSPLQAIVVGGGGVVVAGGIVVVPLIGNVRSACAVQATSSRAAVTRIMSAVDLPVVGAVGLPLQVFDPWADPPAEPDEQQRRDDAFPHPVHHPQ